MSAMKLPPAASLHTRLVNLIPNDDANSAFELAVMQLALALSNRLGTGEPFTPEEAAFVIYETIENHREKGLLPVDYLDGVYALLRRWIRVVVEGDVLQLDTLQTLDSWRAA